MSSELSDNLYDAVFEHVENNNSIKLAKRFVSQLTSRVSAINAIAAMAREIV